MAKYIVKNVNKYFGITVRIERSLSAIRISFPILKRHGGTQTYDQLSRNRDFNVRISEIPFALNVQTG